MSGLLTKPFALLVVLTLYTVSWLLHAYVTRPTVEPITLRVSPRTAFAPVDLNIQVRVHPDPTDRWIDVWTDGVTYSRRSVWTIEGDRTLYTVLWKDVPQGDYDVCAALGQNQHTRASARQTVTVTAP